MKLKKIKIFPKGANGWCSEDLTFADNITQIIGPNGSGKTPIVQSISFCLGYPNEFRNDIYEKCDYAILTVEVKGSTYHFKRYYIKNLHIEVKEPIGPVQTFYDEATHSAYMLELLGYKTTELVDIRSKSTPPYLSSLLPIFYLDQDTGYGSLYAPPSNFVKDQFSEMVRIAFRLSPKNSVDEKRARKQAKDNLDSLDRRLQLLNKQLNSAKSGLGHISATPEEIRNEIQSLELQLENFKNAGATHDDALNVFDRFISKKRADISHIEEQILEIIKREKSLNKIIGDINVEIETVSLNEGARRVFMSFEEICGSNSCQLFSQSSSSYSKNLLYLKDQLKDLERNCVADSITLSNLQHSKSKLEDDIRLALDERISFTVKPEISVLVESISAIKNKIFELQSQVAELDHISDLEDMIVSSSNERNSAYEKVRGQSSSRSSSPELTKIKYDLKELFVIWLDAIHTTNINKDISLVDDFIPVLGVETVKQLKGSTKIRTVLAYHAALLELLMSKPVSNFRFLILDTPKQHDIENKDLDGYMKALKKLCSAVGVQVVFSTTGYRYEGDDLDIDWIPKFPGEDHSMFLKQNDIIFVSDE